MMKAEELRIGNLVQQGEIIELRASSARVRYVRSDTKEEATALVRYEDLEPVRLSGQELKTGDN